MRFTVLRLIEIANGQGRGVLAVFLPSEWYIQLCTELGPGAVPDSMMYDGVLVAPSHGPLIMEFAK